MEKSDITLGFVGSGGDGVVSAGEILTSSAASAGLRCMMVKSFGPQIRGGESSCRVRIAREKVFSQGNGLDILVCFNWSDYTKFSGELEVENDVIILMDEADETAEEELPVPGGNRRTVLKIPFAKIATDGKNPKGKNMVMLGAIAQLFDLPREHMEQSIEKRFRKKKPEVAEANLCSLRAGAEYVNTHHQEFDFKFTAQSIGKNLRVMTGNEAVAYGALRAGCKFYSSYPITPASEIMEWMSKWLPRFGGKVVQAEDEISAVCMVTGATYGGVKSMTATSGPGLSLKTETIGLGTMAELPYVIVDVQRGGPSTGMPTKSEQGDLHQAVYGMHGDAPHAVLAAADVEDCARATIEAFNIAEIYQMPVILLTDQFLAHRKETVTSLDYRKVRIENRLSPRRLSEGIYKRFVDSPDGISPMTWPGVKNGAYLCSGIEHDEYGAPTSKQPVHEKMSAKRHKKVVDLEKNFKYIRRYGDRKPKVGVIGWGSNKGVIREAVDYCVSKGDSVGGVVPQLLYPLQQNILKRFFKGLDVLVVVETSFGGQFLRYIRSWIDIPEKVLHLKRSGGRPFTAREIITEIDKGLDFL